MRVVFLTHNYPRHHGDMAGGFLHPLARALRDRGVDLRVVAPSDGGRGGRETLDGVPVHRVRYARPEHETLAYTGTMVSALRSPAGLRALGGMVRAFTAGAREALGEERGVIHAHWWFPAGVAVPGRTPSVVTCHGTDIRLLAGSRLGRILGRRTLRRARVVTTVSSHLAAMITRHTGRALPDDAIQGMPLAEVDRPASSGGGGIVLLGRLTPQKRLDLALEALAALQRGGHAVKATVVGDGPERARLMALAGGLGLGQVVTWAGSVAPADVPGFLATADACLMTAHDEGLGLAAAEALIQGVPTVACSDGGGVLDIVPTVGGGRVVRPDPQALASALAEVLGVAAERAAARRVGETWAARLAPAQVAERCLTWYARALDA